MFTGIIEEVGTVRAIERGAQSARFTIGAETVTGGTKIGDSITVNGACLTVVEAAPGHVAFDAVYETLQKTALGALAIGDPVNLERSLAVGGRFDGHIVQGHVDGVGTVASIREVDNSYYIYVTASQNLMRYIVRKGSVALDGISLTVVEANDKTFSVAIIPHTWEHTNLHVKRAGDTVNLETDVIGKYVEKMLGGDHARPETPARLADLSREERPLLGATLADWD
ncbi:MAG: riboflavin synthase [Armatimonadetes bacterium]|nr:riboflavin synthase [Armatimonadota bacterium]